MPGTGSNHAAPQGSLCIIALCGEVADGFLDIAEVVSKHAEFQILETIKGRGNMRRWTAISCRQR